MLVEARMCMWVHEPQLFLRKHMSVKALEYKDAHTSHTRLRLEPLCPVELSAGILKNVTWLR